MADKDNVQPLTSNETKIDNVNTSSYMFYFLPATDEFIHPVKSADFEEIWKNNHIKIEAWRESEEKYSYLLANYISDEQQIKDEYSKNWKKFQII